MFPLELKMQTTSEPHSFGRIPSPLDQRDYQLAAFMATPIAQMDHVLFGKRQVWTFDRVLNQGNSNHCVGFAFADFGNTLPIDSEQTAENADALYYLAKGLDGQPADEDGTNLRSGAKAFKSLGHIQAYAFAHTTDEIATWILNHGPVVVGTNWYEGMEQTDRWGYVHPTGQCMGGHAWLLIGVDYRNPLNRYFVGLNSWGESWGERGTFNLSAGDLARLMRESGEAVTAVEVPLAIPVTLPNTLVAETTVVQGLTE
jgi:hypothetical protein